MPKKTTDKEAMEKNKETEKKVNKTAKLTKTTTATKKSSGKKTTTAKKAEPTTKTVASKTSKTSKEKVVAPKKETAPKTASKTSKTTNSKTGAKKTTKKTSTTAKNTTKKKTVKKETVKIEEPKKEEKVKEQTIIEKIKAFIAKIVAMQEEARLEEEGKKEELNTEKNTAKKHTKKEEPEKKSYILEYYDLPYRYNETVVKILAQTPKRLFVYWDISDSDRQKYIQAFGERFFEETYPVLLVHNEDMNYTFEVPINDFANSWYLDINDSKAKYTIQLGRKFRQKTEMVNIVASTETANVVLQNDYVPITTSNMLEVPNDHILFENLQSRVLYRNVKTGQESTVEIDNLEFAKRMGHIYSIYDIYKEIYNNEMDSESLTDLLNPSSMSSSVFR